MINVVVVDLEDEGKLTLKNSIRQGLNYSRLMDAMPIDPDMDDFAERNMYMWIASHVIKAEKCPWQPPTIFTKELVEENYQLFLDAFILESGHRLHREASGLHASSASEIERPDEDLTPEQADNPN